MCLRCEINGTSPLITLYGNYILSPSKQGSWFPCAKWSSGTQNVSLLGSFYLWLKKGNFSDLGWNTRSFLTQPLQQAPKPKYGNTNHANYTTVPLLTLLKLLHNFWDKKVLMLFVYFLLFWHKKKKQLKKIKAILRIRLPKKKEIFARTPNLDLQLQEVALMEVTRDFFSCLKKKQERENGKNQPTSVWSLNLELGVALKKKVILNQVSSFKSSCFIGNRWVDQKNKRG